MRVTKTVKKEKISVEDVCRTEDTEDVMKMFVVMNRRNLEVKVYGMKANCRLF